VAVPKIAELRATEVNTPRERDQMPFQKLEYPLTETEYPLYTFAIILFLQRQPYYCVQNLIPLQDLRFLYSPRSFTLAYYAFQRLQL
jgi:hypothetical protein